MVREELYRQVAQAASAGLLRIGKGFEERGLWRDAVSAYLRIVAYYQENAEALPAVERTVSIAGQLEGKGQLRAASSVYDRLDRAARFQRWDGHQVTSEGEIL